MRSLVYGIFSWYPAGQVPKVLFIVLAGQVGFLLFFHGSRGYVLSRLAAFFKSPDNMNTLVISTPETETLAEIFREYHHQQSMLLQQFQAIIESLNLPAASRRAHRIPLPQNQYTIEYVHLHQITHIEAERQYCVFNLIDNRRITTSRNIGEYEKLLGGHPFMRVHRSHIVNLEHVRSFHRNDEELEMPNGKRVVVSRNLRDNVLLRLMEV
jgi:DNA-binding LytR/AlgR family response regulator